MAQLRARSRLLSFAANVLDNRGERYVFIAEPTSGTAARAKGNLYIVAEADRDGPVERAFCRLVAEHVRSEYYRDPARGPLAGLTGALRTAAAKIYADERNPDPTVRPVIGVTCIAACDGTMAIAQTLPVQVYVQRGRDVVLIPDPPLWEDPNAEVDEGQLIGHTPSVRPHLCEETVQPGDLTLVASSALAQSLTGADLALVLQRRDQGVAAQELRNRYADAASTPAYGLLLQFIPDDREKLSSDVPAGTRSGGVGAIFSSLRPAPTARSSSSDGRGVPPATRVTISTRGPETRERQPDPSSTNGTGRPTGSTVHPRSWSNGSDAVSDRAHSGAVRRAPYLSVWPSLPSLHTRRDTVERLRGWPALLLGGLLLLLLLGFGSAQLVHRYRASQERQAIERVVAQVHIMEDVALKSGEASLQVAQLRKAQQLTEDNKRTLPEAEYTTLRTEVQGKIDQIERIGHFESVQRVADFSSEKLVSLSRIAYDGDTVYALDQGNHRVIVMAMNGEKPTYPLASGVKAGNDIVSGITAMTLTPGGLFALDDRRVLWRYGKEKKDISRIKVPGSENWQEPRALVTQGDKLLVLDAKQSRIFQYQVLPGTLGAPTDYIAPTPAASVVDLSHSSDMAADATNVFLLQADGGVIKFSGGTRAEFPESGLSSKMPSPSAIYANARDSSVYVVDATNRRVVRFAKDGRFLQQLLLPENQQKLGVIQSISADEGQNKAVIATENAVATALLGSR